MTPTTEEREQLTLRSMEIILHSGNARENIMNAFDQVALSEFAQAELLLKEAQTDITFAHNSQTEMLQKEANEENYYYSLLFSHAQDTLMTINSELLLAEKMLLIVKALREET